MKIALLALITVLTPMMLSHHASAQSSAPANSCISKSRDSKDNTVFENTCSYKVHVYWVLHNEPDTSYNAYIEPGDQHTAYIAGKGDYSLYACAANYYVVDGEGHVITHLVPTFSCRKS